MSISRVPSNKFERCCICFVMEDRRPSLRGDGRPSTIEVSRQGKAAVEEGSTPGILLILAIRYQEIAIARAIDGQEAALEAASERPRVVNKDIH